MNLRVCANAALRCFHPFRAVATAERTAGSRKWLVPLFAVLAAFSPARAQIGPPVTPGFPNVAQVAGTALSGLNAPQQGRTAIIAYHNGTLFTIPEVPSSQPGADFQVRSWDISDPTQPLLLEVLGQTPMPLSAHGYLKSGDYLIIGPNWPPGTEWSFRATAPLTIDRTTFPETFCVGLRGCQFYPWYAGPVYTLYNTTSGNAHVQLNGVTLSSWDHLGMTGVIGHPFIVGNLLIFVSDESRTGIATYDISDPANPVLLDVLTTGGPGGYHPELWGGDGKLYAVMPYRDRGNGFRIADLTDPADIKFVVDRPLSGTQSMYAQFQDEYGFMGDHKVDMRSFESVLFLNGNAVERPNQPGVIGIDTSQFALPLGNLLVTGGIGPNEGMAIWAHQAEPDTRGPSVGYHIPQAGRTNYPAGAPISLLIHETLESYTIVNGQTFIVRPLGGMPIAGRIFFSYNDVLTFTPDQPLLANTTYEVVIPEGGIKDAAGNGIVGYSFTFSTGSNLNGNAPPQVTSLTASAYPVAPGAPVTLTATATDPNNDPLEYRFDFGDGSPKTAWSSTPSAAASYAEEGHYRVAAQVRDPSGSIDTETLTVTVVNPPTGPQPSSSTKVLCDAAARRVWVVNPDTDTLAALDADALVKVLEVPVCADPRGVARAAGGLLWVACHDDDSLRVLDGAGAPVATLALDYGSAPAGIAASPDGGSVYVALEGSGELARYDAATRQRTGTLALGAAPRAIAVRGDGARVFVTRFLSPANHAEVWEVNAGTFALTRTIQVRKFGGAANADSTATGRGVANYLSAIAIEPDGASAWVASSKPNSERGLLFGPDLDQDNTVRTVVWQIDLASGALLKSIDIDNSDSASALGFSPLGDYLFVTLQGNNQMVVFDLLAMQSTTGLAGFVSRLGTGLAPQGVCGDAPTGRTFVQNFMARSITAIETDELFRFGDVVPASSEISTVALERLAPEVLQGKQVFYNAADPRMSAEGYISCASCHLDGGHDGRTWDFTGRGEGLRNTISLHGRAGTGHGNVHWSANFDEIQDFENDIRNAFGGEGFLSDADFAATSSTLGAPKMGLSAELDALAAYVGSLGAETVPRSPWREADGSMTAAGIAGGAVFDALACGSCHSGPAYTDSTGPAATLHDVGTLRTSSGQRLGGPLTGIDTPTLLGVWDTAPYFHDGSAATLDDVFRVAGGTVLQAETGTPSGAAMIFSQFVDLNNDDTVHNRAYVAFGGSSAQLTLNGVDGGAGGVGAIELRYSIGNPTQLNVTVNGVLHSLTPPTVGNNPTWVHLNWGRVRIENVVFSAGATNTVVFATPGMFPSFSLDDVTITTADDLAAAAPHRAALGLLAADRADLIAYLRQLDGRGAEEGPLPTATSTPTAVPPTPTPTLTPVASSSPNATLPASPTATPGVSGVCVGGISVAQPRLRMIADPFRARFTGRAVIPKPWSGVDPLANGVRIVFSDGGGTVLDLDIPGGALVNGAGWSVNGAGTRWRYVDPAGSVGGVTRLVVRDRSRVEDGNIAWSLRALGGSATLPAVSGSRTDIVLGDPAECASVVWGGPGAPSPSCEGDATRLGCD